MFAKTSTKLSAQTPSGALTVVAFINARFGVALSVSRRMSPSGLVRRHKKICLQTEILFIY